MSNKRQREVKCVPVAELRRKLCEATGRSAADVQGIKQVTVLRSMCQAQGIPIVQSVSGGALPSFVLEEVSGAAFARQYEELSHEHIEKGTRKSYENAQKRMVEWWAGRSEYQHLVENGKVTDLANFPVEAFFAFLVNQVDPELSVANKKRMLIGKGGLANYRKAFSNLYAESNPPVFQSNVMVREICQKMKALRKRHAKEARKEERKPREGKAEVPYGLLLGLAKIFLEEGMFWEHAYCMLCWDLIARSDNIGDLTMDHLRFINDSLQIMFSADKMHTTGDSQSCKEPKHCFANVTDVTKDLFVALALYFLTSPEVGCANKELFPGAEGTQKARFRSRLNEALRHPRIVLLLERYGCGPEDIGPHSFRKGAGTYCTSGCTGGPSIVAILLRGGWEIGQVLDRYLRYSEAGDEFVGRVISGLPLNDAAFTSPPPHFKVLSEAKRGDLQRDVKLLFRFCEVNPRLYPVAEALFASVLRAIPALLDGNDAVLPLGSAGRSSLLSTALMRNEELLRTWSGEVIVEDPDFKVSGVPTWHTMLASVLENTRLTKSLPNLIKTDLLAELERRDALSGTVSVFTLQKELEKSKKDCVEEMRKMVIEELDRREVGRRGDADGAGRDAQVVGGRYWWAVGTDTQPSLHRLPVDFKLDQCQVRTAWGLYWQGKQDPKDSAQRFPPYRVLKAHDFSHNTSRKQLSGWRTCFEMDTAHLLHGNESYKRAVEACKRGESATLQDENDMWAVVEDHFRLALAGHRRPGEAKIGTLVTRRYEAHALLTTE